MAKLSISDLIESYVSPGHHDEGPSTSLISIRVDSEVKEELNLLASVLGTKPSPLAAELFIIALRDAIDSLPDQMKQPFEALEEERQYIESRR